MNELYKRAIGEDDTHSKSVLLPMLFLTQSMIVEDFLYQLLNKEQLSEDIVDKVRSKSSLVDKWRSLIEECVINFYGKPISELSNLLKLKYDELDDSVKKYIEKLVRVRNKFAHGQHECAFNI